MRGSHPITTLRQPQRPGISRRYPPPPSAAAPQRPPPQRPPIRRPNFVVDLVSDNRNLCKSDIEALINRCKAKPERAQVCPSNCVVASLYYEQWVDALDALVWLWESRLDRVHNFLPELTSHVSVPSDRVELEDRLKALFSDRIKLLIDGDEVKKCEVKRDSLAKEYERVHRLSKRPQRQWHDLNEKENMYKCEIELVEKRIREFKSAMNCLLANVNGEALEEYGEDRLPVFEFDQLRNWIKLQSSTMKWSQMTSLMMKWCQIQRLMMRECRRLEEGLPIYGYRQQILQQINHQQV